MCGRQAAAATAGAAAAGCRWRRKAAARNSACLPAACCPKPPAAQRTDALEHCKKRDERSVLLQRCSGRSVTCARCWKLQVRLAGGEATRAAKLRCVLAAAADIGAPVYRYNNLGVRSKQCGTCNRPRRATAAARVGSRAAPPSSAGENGACCSCTHQTIQPLHCASTLFSHTRMKCAAALLKSSVKSSVPLTLPAAQLPPPMPHTWAWLRSRHSAAEQAGHQ